LSPTSQPLVIDVEFDLAHDVPHRIDVVALAKERASKPDMNRDIAAV
jgi:hypothetical protein